MADDVKRPQFGNRHLTSDEDVFKHNAWDNVEWDEEQQQLASDKVAANSCDVLNDQVKFNYDTKANEYWNKFYDTHQRDFFKDRHWLFTEFNELIANQTEPSEDTSADTEYLGSAANFKIFEVGCGVGNTIIPILQMNL